MKWLILGILCAFALEAVYAIAQVFEGEHEHKKSPPVEAIAAAVCVAVSALLIYVLLNWV